jgi:hypothetical protein
MWKTNKQTNKTNDLSYGEQIAYLVTKIGNSGLFKEKYASIKSERGMSCSCQQ